MKKQFGWTFTDVAMIKRKQLIDHKVSALIFCNFLVMTGTITKKNKWMKSSIAYNFLGEEKKSCTWKKSQASLKPHKMQ